MPDRPRKDLLQTSEEVLESEIRDLEEPMLRSWVPWVTGIVAIGIVLAIALLAVAWEQGRYGSWLAGKKGLFRVEATTPSGDLSDVPRAFQWSPVEGAKAYLVTVRAKDGDVVLTRRVESTVLVPLDVEFVHMVPGSYDWTVEARDGQGAALGTGAATFRILP